MARDVLDRTLENIEIASKEKIPLCQDTGMAMALLELGQDAHIVGGDLYIAVDDGARRGYTDGYLRKSVVRQPLSTLI